MAIGHWFKGFTKWYFDTDNEGSGSSDFSTAEVTLISSELHHIKIMAPTLTRGYVMPMDETIQDMDFTVVLGENGCAIQLHGDDFAIVSITLSGSIENMGDGFYLITGDCTITIS